MPTFDSKISLGAILQMIVLIVAMALAWGKVVTRDELKSDYVKSDVYNLQLGIIDSKIQAVNGKVDEIKSDVKEIKRVVKQ